MTRQHYWTIACLSGMGLAMLMAGCDDPASRERIIRRHENLSKTARMFGDIEANRPRALDWAVNTLKDQYERDVERLPQNQEAVGRMIQSDFDRWQERQPLYKDEIDRLLKGNPENIRHTAPELAW